MQLPFRTLNGLPKIRGGGLLVSKTFEEVEVTRGGYVGPKILSVPSSVKG